jgi:hypothetical protein
VTALRILGFTKKPPELVPAPQLADGVAQKKISLDISESNL